MPESDPIQDEFSALIDQELDAETRATVEARLSESAELLRALHAMKQVSDLYASLPRVKAPPDFESGTRLRMARQGWRLRMRSRLRRAWIPAAIAAAAVYAVGAAFYFSRNLSQDGAFRTAQQNTTQVPGLPPTNLPDAQTQKAEGLTAIPNASAMRPQGVFETLQGESQSGDTAQDANLPTELLSESALVTADDTKADATPPPLRDEANKSFISSENVPGSPSVLSQKSSVMNKKAQESAIIDNKEDLLSPSTLAAPIPSQPAETLQVAEQPESAPQTGAAYSMQEKNLDAPNLLAQEAVGTGAGSRSPARAAGKASVELKSFEALGQRFALVEMRWTATDYAGENLVTISEASPFMRSLSQDEPEGATALLSHRPVVFKYRDVWYLLEAEKATQ